jgi:hypothetical protein
MLDILKELVQKEEKEREKAMKSSRRSGVQGFS